MGKILHIIELMGGEIIEQKPKIINCIVRIQCECGHVSEVSAGAVYKQYKRKHDYYMCKSCAGRSGWTEDKKLKVSKKSKKQWKDPDYAGTVIGKAMANQIRKMTETGWLT
jgi:hypothetical protein